MTQPTDVAAVGARLRETREFLNLSPAFVSHQLKIPLARLDEVEQGSRPATDAEIEQLAALYRLSVSFIRTGRDDGDIGEATERAFMRTAGELSESERTNVERFALFLQNFRRE